MQSCFFGFILSDTALLPRCIPETSLSELTLYDSRLLTVQSLTTSAFPAECEIGIIVVIAYNIYIEDMSFVTWHGSDGRMSSSYIRRNGIDEN